MNKIMCIIITAILLSCATVIAVDIQINSPLPQNYPDPDLTLDVTFSENYQSWYYTLNQQQTDVCTSTPGTLTEFTQNSGKTQLESYI